jgi:hypothetical protein
MPDYLTSIHRERMPIHPQIPFKPPGVALAAFPRVLYIWQHQARRAFSATRGRFPAISGISPNGNLLKPGRH